MSHDEPSAWEMSWGYQLRMAEPKSARRATSLSQQFATEKEALEAKEQKQQDGFIAAVRPLFVSRKQRERRLQRQQTVFGAEWPPRAQVLR
jgi:hypothetical protein